MSEELSVEATGETVGEAKWSALRELERLAPGLDRESVRFQVVSEGERGLLGVGYTPARVVASADRPSASAAHGAGDEGEAAVARELLERVLRTLEIDAHVEVIETDQDVVASVAGGDLGVLIGRHGQTIDAIQYLANAIAHRSVGEDRRRIVIDKSWPVFCASSASRALPGPTRTATRASSATRARR